MHKKSLSSSSGFLPYSDVVLIDISAWLEVEERERERERERDRVGWLTQREQQQQQLEKEIQDSRF
jgi:hypothetical protein